MPPENVPEPEDAGAASLEQILQQLQGIDPGAPGMIASMASVHAMWMQAWLDTEKFTREEAFELVRILVATSTGGLRSLA